MTKERISSPDLAWIFVERLKAFKDCPGVAVAIVPDGKSVWLAVAKKNKNKMFNPSLESGLTRSSVVCSGVRIERPLGIKEIGLKAEWNPDSSQKQHALESFDGADLIMNSTMAEIASLADPE